MNIQVHLYSQAQPVTIDGARNAYTKDGLYCVMLDNGTVFKFPLLHVFRIREVATAGEKPA